MKRLNNFKFKNNILAISAAMMVFFMTHPAYAKLDNAKTALETLQTELTSKIIPIAATLILLCLAIGYAGRYIEKDTFVRWAIGVVIAGSAVQLTTMLFKPN
ncbi:VirB2 family type IV secretion system major pilin TrwL [Bartonella refiksaydamii]|uniref:VirB2 family type IV secretion system major pilin TrwL n=1 Tax=Bartonella refiksaydamii TaxID=2654951 RepID=UPI0012EB51FA|nr:VirB2 family type IV secretion system major pilin TrwL [Bartonella refiksaydamii]